jgi:manganese/zinc/iron transport system permease protein
MTTLAQTLFTVAGYDVRPHDLWIVATAAACSIACGLLGCFLVLRRMSLLGDAISHAILPGLAAAFVLTNSREPLAMLSGALVVGVLTALLSHGLTRWGRVPEDSAMGVVFTSLFALGVVLITLAARNVDLDPGCVLYGLIEFSPFDTTTVLGLELPRSFVWLSVILAANTALVTLFYKELKIVCFDPYLATTMGISAAVVHYGLMTAVAATCVASFEAVGSILVVSMLVAPGATAHLLTDRLSRMLWIAAGVAGLSAVVGYVLAVWLNTSVAGMVSTVVTGLFVCAVLFAPRYGWVAKQLRRLALSLRIAQEDILGLHYRWHERAAGHEALTPNQTLEATQGGLLGRLAIANLMRRGHLRRSCDGTLVPTESGLRAAQPVVRGHRLWESYLARRLNISPERVHTTAHRAEHYLSDALQAKLDEHVEGESDPHGRPIPPMR